MIKKDGTIKDVPEFSIFWFKNDITMHYKAKDHYYKVDCLRYLLFDKESPLCNLNYFQLPLFMAGNCVCEWFD